MSRFKYNRHNLTVSLILAASSLLGGCESAPTALERNFGSSVRSMIELQTAQPGYRGDGMSGQKSEAVWRAYSGEVADPKKVEQSILQIQLGK
jgi:hypothetical protein